MKRCFSAIQPTGIPTLGNVLGALQNWVALTDEYECIYAVANLHAITVRQDKAAFEARQRRVYALCRAMGIGSSMSTVDDENAYHPRTAPHNGGSVAGGRGPDEANESLHPPTPVLTASACSASAAHASTFFIQSHVPAHAELAWILSCFTMQGELGRMTQYKDKSQKHADNINAGLFTYPVLMAADILLYGAHAVPVGHDQKQHVELTRDIANRFNGLYGDVLVVPEPFIPQIGGRIMSLLDPSRKMDKSDPNPGGFISVLDDRDTILKKCKRAVTDSDATVRFDPDAKPGVSNLLSILHLCTGKPIADLEADFAGKGYGDFKTAVGEAVDGVIAPIRDGAAELLRDPAALDALMQRDAEKAQQLAAPMLRRVKDAVGIL